MIITPLFKIKKMRIKHASVPRRTELTGYKIQEPTLFSNYPEVSVNKKALTLNIKGIKRSLYTYTSMYLWTTQYHRCIFTNFPFLCGRWPCFQDYVLSILLKFLLQEIKEREDRNVFHHFVFLVCSFICFITLLAK